MMKIILTLLILSLLSFSFAFAGEEDVLMALERIRAGIDNGISYGQYCQLLLDARSQIDLLNKHENSSVSFQLFRRTVELSYGGYDVGKMIWSSTIGLQIEKERLADEEQDSSARKQLDQEIEIREQDIQKVWWAAGRALDLAYERRQRLSKKLHGSPTLFASSGAVTTCNK